MAHDIITRKCLDDAYCGGGVIVWGMGGCGKSETIYAIQTTLSRAGVKLFTTSTTILAANHIGRMTIHSLLRLLLGSVFNVLSGTVLSNLQSMFAGCKCLIIDEFSMLSASELCYVDRRLRQIMCRDVEFGGICVGLFGDPGQLLPVKGFPLWYVPTGNPNLTKYLSELFGKTLFDSVQDVVH